MSSAFTEPDDIQSLLALPTPGEQMPPEPDPTTATVDDLWIYVRHLQEQLQQSSAREAYLLAHVQQRLSIPQERELRQTTIQFQQERETLRAQLTALQQRYSSQQRALVSAIISFILTALGCIWLLTR